MLVSSSIIEFVLFDYSLEDLLINKILIMAGLLSLRHLRRKNYCFIHFSSDLLKTTLVRRDYLTVINYLIENGFVEADVSYSSGRFSKSYRIRKPFLHDLVEFGPELKECTDISLSPELARTSLSEEGFKKSASRVRRFRNKFRIACHEHAIQALREKRFWLKQDEKSGRLYHNISNLSKKLRPFLLIDGEPTTEIDIRNSQPFFAASLYPEGSPEKALYLQLATSGHFYEALNAKLAQPYLNRDKLKVQIYKQIFFGKVSDKYPLWVAFKAMFPELASIFVEMKSKEKNRPALALQKKEASVMIGRVLPALRQLGIPAVTVHDSIICKRNDYPAVNQVLRDCLASEMGSVPELRSKPELSAA